MSVAVPRPRAGAEQRLASLAKIVLLFRLLALNVTVVELVTDPDRAAVVGVGLVVLAGGTFAQLRGWSRGEAWVRRPRLLAADWLLTMSLLAYLGPQSPFFLSTLGIALIGGVAHGRAGSAVAGVALVGAYYVVLAGTGGDAAREFPTLVTFPLLYVAAASGAAAIRDLLEDQAETESRLRGAQLAAVAGEERARVAREMHDSLGKTLYGISLGASGLAKRVATDAPAAAAQARTLSGAAQIAAAEARELISDLRSDALDLPLGEALASHVARWSEETGIPADVRGQLVDLPRPGTRYELFSIVKEALRNVEAHARAHHVDVVLEELDGEVRLAVCDDGVGMGASGTPEELEREGHWGLIGMGERAERVGARVHIESPATGGTHVVVRVPSGDVRTPEPWDDPAPAPRHQELA